MGRGVALSVKEDAYGRIRRGRSGWGDGGGVPGTGLSGLKINI